MVAPAARWPGRGHEAPAWLCLAEPSASYLSEAELSQIWEGLRFPAGALAAGGAPVEVLDPGRRGGGAGPDFRSAVVVLDGERRLGDVELHVRASSFQGHGHHLDPAYDGLVLHVVFLDDTDGGTRLRCGRRVPVAAFGPWVDRRAADVADWLARPALWEEPCRSAGARLGEDAVAEAVSAAGRGRLAARAAALAESCRLEGEEQALWLALLEALAYGGDRDGFLRLGHALPAPTLRGWLLGRDGASGLALVEAALLATGGLVPAPAAAGRLPPPLVEPVRRLGSRPANRPERRLAAAARLFLRAAGDLVGHAEASVAGAESAPDLIAAWTVGPPAGLREALVGRDRAGELLLNAVLPFVSLRPRLEARALGLAAALPPLPPYGKTAFLERNLRRAGGGRAVRRALDQQGLLALHADWCSQGGCGRCPLS